MCLLDEGSKGQWREGGFPPMVINLEEPIKLEEPIRIPNPPRISVSIRPSVSPENWKTWIFNVVMKIRVST